MNEAEFHELMQQLARHLEREKTFIENPERIAEVQAAAELAMEMFPNANITVASDPLQMGVLILCIDDFDIVVRETERFATLISKANNFEIYPVGDERMRCNILFAKAMHEV